MALAISIPNPLFASAQLTGSAATYYTVPTLPSTVSLQNARIRFTNTDSAIHQVTAYAIPSGGTAGVSNCFMNAESIAPNAHYDVDVPQMGPAGFLQAFADTTLKVTISALGGIVISQ